MSTFQEPALKFNETLLHPNDRGNTLLQFREQGFATISDVFLDDTVDAYLEQLLPLVVEGGPWWSPLSIQSDDPLIVWPAKAPRLRQVLRGAFMPWIDEPLPVLMHPAWLVKPSNPDPRIVHDWHKDGDHQCVLCHEGYTYPQVVHTAMYFADMTPELGPTYVIPRSHRDPAQSPYNGAHEVPFLPRKGDVVIWDQRLWHRASARTVPGTRIAALFPFFPAPVIGQPRKAGAAQREALKSAADGEEQILFGGAFGAL